MAFGFNLENDLRKWVRQQTNGVAMFIEPGMGSTDGLPDCFVPYYGRLGVVVWLELKLGELKADKLTYEVRAAQKDIIGRMVTEGLKVGFLVAIKHTSLVIALQPTKEAMFGNVPRISAMVMLGQARVCDLKSMPQRPLDPRLGLVEVACNLIYEEWLG